MERKSFFFVAQMICEVLILLNDGGVKRRIYINLRYTGDLFAKMC